MKVGSNLKVECHRFPTRGLEELYALNKKPKILLQIYSILVKRFKSFKKTKEEQIKYIFRRVYNFKKNPVSVDRAKL